ncbi:MAG: rod shape-determining protein MreC [Chloroflexi bacterium]|nr:rod shape-determining protein MreC [Chloroflexota bacterium]
MYASSRNRMTVLVVLLAFALAAFLFHQTGQLQPFEDLALGLLQPVLGGAATVGDSAQSITGDLADVSKMRAQLAQLQARVDAMTLDNVRLTELENENKLLREQLGYKQANSDYELMGAVVVQRNPDLARVIGVDPSNLVHFVIVDQGSEEGVKPGMPVITPQGLVGRVTSTGAHWAKVLLILDPSSSVNAVVQSTRATGVAQGDVNGNLIIKYVPQGEAIKTGDKILTSGLGSNFPKRLVIGQVTEVRKRDIDLFQEASIQPSVDFARLEFVLIMKKFTPSDITTEPTPTPTPRPTPTKAPSQ